MRAGSGVGCANGAGCGVSAPEPRGSALIGPEGVEGAGGVAPVIDEGAPGAGAMPGGSPPGPVGPPADGGLPPAAGVEAGRMG